MFDFFQFNLAIYDTDTVLTRFPEERRLHLTQDTDWSQTRRINCTEVFSPALRTAPSSVEYNFSPPFLSELISTITHRVARLLCGTPPT